MGKKQKTVAQRADDGYARTVLSRSDLVHRGLTGRLIAESVARGELLHVRRDRYALPSTHRDIIEAVRILSLIHI